MVDTIKQQLATESLSQLSSEIEAIIGAEGAMPLIEEQTQLDDAGPGSLGCLKSFARASGLLANSIKDSSQTL